MNTAINVGSQYISIFSPSLLIMIIRYFSVCVFGLVHWLFIFFIFYAVIYSEINAFTMR